MRRFIITLATEKRRQFNKGFNLCIRLRRQILTTLAKTVDPNHPQTGIGCPDGVPCIGGQKDTLITFNLESILCEWIYARIGLIDANLLNRQSRSSDIFQSAALDGGRQHHWRTVGQDEQPQAMSL